MYAVKNKVQLIGRAGADPEVKVFGEGKKRATLTIATTEAYKNDKGDRVEDTQWHRVVTWGATAEFVEKFVTKGKEVIIDGKLLHRNYEDKNGEKRYITEVVAHNFLLV
jgi:single-strand DNA-binding protein